MILELIFFVGLLSTVVNARSTNETRKLHGVGYGFIPIGQKPLPIIMSFIGVYDWYKQSGKNTKLEPVVVMKMNTRKPLAVIDLDTFVDLIR